MTITVSDHWWMLQAIAVIFFANLLTKAFFWGMTELSKSENSEPWPVWPSIALIGCSTYAGGIWYLSVY